MITCVRQKAFLYDFRRLRERFCRLLHRRSCYRSGPEAEEGEGVELAIVVVEENLFQIFMYVLCTATHAAVVMLFFTLNQAAARHKSVFVRKEFSTPKSNY